MADVAFDDRESQKPTVMTDGQADGTLQKATTASRYIARHGRVALERLFEAVLYAKDLNQNPWDFALEISVLRQGGLGDSQIRWLLCKGFLDHAKELRNDGESPTRSFKPRKGLSFSKRSCFLLTESGQTFFRHIIGDGSTTKTERGGFSKIAKEPSEQHFNGRPFWDRDRQELRVDGQVVKRFKVPAPNQEVILATFEEEGWPQRIDDPLPPHPSLEPKRRLQDTIVSLNRNQKAAVLRFFGDGTGQSVCWQFIQATELAGTSIRRPK